MAMEVKRALKIWVILCKSFLTCFEILYICVLTMKKEFTSSIYKLAFILILILHNVITLHSLRLKLVLEWYSIICHKLHFVWLSYRLHQFETYSDTLWWGLAPPLSNSVSWITASAFAVGHGNIFSRKTTRTYRDSITLYRGMVWRIRYRPWSMAGLVFEFSRSHKVKSYSAARLPPYMISYYYSIAIHKSKRVIGFGTLLGCV